MIHVHVALFYYETVLAVSLVLDNTNGKDRQYGMYII